MGDETFDGRVRQAIATSIRGRGAIPTIAEAARDLRADEAAVRASFERMIAAHVFVPKHGSSEIHSYNPFCAEGTDFRVRSGGREWWAMCGWDALGIPAALGVAGSVESSCPDCGERIVIDVDRDGAQSTAAGAVGYAKKLTPGWRRHTADEAQALFASLGLDREFWRLV